MKRLAVTLPQIAERNNLLRASHAATASAGSRSNEACAWLARLEDKLAELSAAILGQSAPDGDFRRFTIFDPKRREIVAPCFADRVLHHAIINLCGGQFERGLVDSSFACRPGKGVHAAVAHVQKLLQRYPCWMQVDVAHYFANIDHALLLASLARRFKGADFLALCARIVERSGTNNGVGLPIGALTSQHFANHFLDHVDRWLLAHPLVLGHARYMDDIVWFCEYPQHATTVLDGLKGQMQALRLTLKTPVRLGQSARGIRYCGFRIRRGLVLPSTRKIRRYRNGLRTLTGAVAAGALNSAQAQRCADVQTARLAHTQSLRLRQALCERFGAYDQAL